MEEKNKKYPEGHFMGMWMGIGIAIFSGVGVSLSIVLKIQGLIGLFGSNSNRPLTFCELSLS